MTRRPPLALLLLGAVLAASAQEDDGASGQRVRSWLRGQGCQADYQRAEDRERGFVYLHTRSDQELQAARARLAGFADLLWRDLFQRREGRTLTIVLLDRGDARAVFEEGQGGFFVPQMQALVCAEVPATVEQRCSVVIHELTHALHFADQAARGQRHPTWLVEGLATLFETSRVVEGRLTPTHSGRLRTAQEAVREGRAVPWRRLLRMSQGAFHEKPATLAYAQARTLLFYVWEQGHLQRFYREYTSGASRGEASGAEALEVVFGRPLEEVERAWKEWLLAQEQPPIPFLGVASLPEAGGCRVVTVASGSGAEAAGIALGDVLLSAQGVPLPTPEDLVEVLSAHAPGDTLELELRRGEERLRVRVTLGVKR